MNQKRLLNEFLRIICVHLRSSVANSSSRPSGGVPAGGERGEEVAEGRLLGQPRRLPPVPAPGPGEPVQAPVGGGCIPEVGGLGRECPGLAPPRPGECARQAARSVSSPS